jgi:iron complex outermembrane receptor protein
MRMILRTALLFAGCGAALFGVGARAQEGQPPQQPAARSSDLEELVVTARRREERMQNVPVAVTTFTPERPTDQNEGVV